MLTLFILLRESGTPAGSADPLFVHAKTRRTIALSRPQMLSKKDRSSVIAAIESRLGDYFDGDDMLWGEEDWLTAEGVSNDFGGHNIDAQAAAAWLVDGVDTRYSLLGEG